MITKEDFYRCYSFNLMKYLEKYNIRYLLVAKDIQSNKVFYLFEKTTKFNQLLQQWENNNPKNKT